MSIRKGSDIIAGSTPDQLPTQTGNSGKFLTTDGTAASWANVDALPSQSGQSGKYLTTNGTAASWATVNIPTVDQTYSGTSTNAQSGVAVKSAIDAALGSVYKPAGSIAYASLPTLAAGILGNVYNVTDAFTTDTRFVEGSGKEYPAGTNVAVVNTGTNASPVYKFDVLAGFVDLSGYQTTITGAATSITTNNLTANKVLVSDNSGKVSTSSISNTEVGYLSGATSNIQTQINAKAADNSVVHITEQGDWLPNFDIMDIVQTIEFDTADTSWHQIFSRTNTDSSLSALTDIIYFRMTITGTNINHVCDFVVRWEGRLDFPRVM